MESIALPTGWQKDVANGVPGLDANILLSPAVLYPILEEWARHDWDAGDFQTTGVNGNGTATNDPTNHEMDLSTGTGAVGFAGMTSRKTWTMGAKPIVVNILVQNLANGASSGALYGIVGLGDDISSPVAQGAYFMFLDPSGWNVTTRDATGAQTTSITALASGDLVSIVVTSSKALFFVNGTLVGTHTTKIPSGAVYLGCSVFAQGLGPTVARTLSVDMMSIKVYK